mgnify:CR=1 FL=1
MDVSLLHVQTMARYNRWMNQKVYDGCAGLSEEDRKRDMGAFFRSIHGTLNGMNGRRRTNASSTGWRYSRRKTWRAIWFIPVL